MKETDLYQPVKDFLEGQGYEVKAEVGACDVLACRGEEDPVIVELKSGFSLSLFQQGIDRLRVSDAVYLAVPRKSGTAWRRSLTANVTLCRRLGLGLILVRLRDGHVEVRLDPGPYAPRKSKRRKDRLLREFARRDGDPNVGGATRTGLVTAYRQDAMRCAVHLAEHDVASGAEIAKATSVATATRILWTNHYGWFERRARGAYALTPLGRKAVEGFATEVKSS